VRVSAATFKTSYKDMQVDVVDPGKVVLTDTINASKQAVVKGAELDITAAPPTGLLLALS